MKTLTERAGTLPAWLPDSARLYLRHTEQGLSLRELARSEGLHASTVLRRVRACENRRDDPLVDEALDALGAALGLREGSGEDGNGKGDQDMTAAVRQKTKGTEAPSVEAEARRVLRRLCEPGAMLVVAPEMAKALVMRGDVRMAVTDREVAQVFAMRDWIAVHHSGKVTTYVVTSAGRAAVRRQIVDDAARRAGVTADAFAEQHREIEAGTDGAGGRRLRVNVAESPLAILARRRDKDGTTFLSPEMVTAGERLREDFELAQLGPRVAQNWERFLTGSDRGAFGPDSGGSTGGSSAARDRVATALRELGPGLGDMVLRCCCFLEGLEQAEQRLGWSARSGKIVLRIALTRLARHYSDTYGKFAPMIG